ncbi:hypothetical protein RUND412_002601 [Rhizina undulata]
MLKPLRPREPMTPLSPFTATLGNPLQPYSGTAIPAISYSVSSSAMNGAGAPLQLLLSNPIKFVKSKTMPAATPIQTANSKFFMKSREQKQRLKNNGAIEKKKEKSAVFPEEKIETKTPDEPPYKGCKANPYNKLVDPMFLAGRRKRKLRDVDGQIESVSKKGKRNALHESFENIPTTKMAEGMQGTDEARLKSTSSESFNPNPSETISKKRGNMTGIKDVRNTGRQALYPYRARGISNGLNECYQIAAIHFLASSPHIRSCVACPIGESCVACTLYTIFLSLYYSSPLTKDEPFDRKNILPAHIAQFMAPVLRECGSPFHHEGTQEDACQFVNKLIQEIDEQNRNLPWPGKLRHDLSEVELTTALVKRQVLACVTCDYKSQSIHTEHSIMFRPKERFANKTNMDLIQIMTNYFATEYIKMYCEGNCKKKNVQFRKDYRLLEAPNFLRVWILRDKNGRLNRTSTGMVGRKNMSKVIFPEVVILPDGAGNENKYELQAIISHEGNSIDSGHFVSFIRQPDGIWTLVNDDKVRVLSWEQVRDQLGHRYQPAMFGFTKLSG